MVPVRRFAGLIALAGAGLALVIGLVFAIQSLMFQVSAAEAAGEVVAVQPVLDAAGRPQIDRHLVVVEFPDRNGQSRRFDAEVEGQAPEKGAEVPVRYRMGPPVDARLANYWLLWRPATIAGAGALGLGLVAEELLRRRPARTSPSRTALSGGAVG